MERGQVDLSSPCWQVELFCDDPKLTGSSFVLPDEALRDVPGAFALRRMRPNKLGVFSVVKTRSGGSG